MRSSPNSPSVNAPLARHTLIDLHGCDRDLLNAPDTLKQLLLEAIRRGHGTVVTDVFHTFNPHGVTGVVVIAESHVAIHTWPEHGYAALDIFSCGTKLDAEIIRDWISSGVRASRSASQEITRPVRRNPE